MSVFVDTGVFYAQHDEDAGRHEEATAAMRRVVEGEFGRPLTTDYVYSETVTLALSRFSDPDTALGAGDRVLGRNGYPDVVNLVVVDSDLFDAATDLHRRYSDQGLSFADATTVALVERRDVDRVLAFDDDFDGLVNRIDPSSVDS